MVGGEGKGAALGQSDAVEAESYRRVECVSLIYSQEGVMG